MKIENPKLVIGLFQILEGVINLCRGGQDILDPEGKHAGGAPADPALVQSAPAAAAEKTKKGKGTKTVAVEVKSPTSENVAAPGAPAPTHDDVRERIKEYMGLPGVGKEKGKALVLGFGVEKLSELTPEQLPNVMAAINAAMTAVKSSAEEW